MPDRSIIAAQFAPVFTRSFGSTNKSGLMADVDVQWCFDQADKFLSTDASNKQSQVEANDTALIKVPEINNLVSVTVVAVDAETITLSGSDLNLGVGVTNAVYSLNDIQIVRVD